MKNSSKKNDFSLKNDDFSKFDDSIITKIFLKISTRNRRDVTTENSREKSTENRVEIETENRIKIETDRIEIEIENRIEIETENCIEIVISIEKNEFETFARFRDLVIMIKKTFFLNDILIDIRMNFQITNENIEMINRNFIQKQHEKITIFMKFHSFSCLI